VKSKPFRARRAAEGKRRSAMSLSNRIGTPTEVARCRPFGMGPDIVCALADDHLVQPNGGMI
jgi:hypothetical protein